MLNKKVLDDSDLVQVNEAARLAGLTPAGVSRLMDTGKLPDYRLSPQFVEGVAMQRFTSRAAAIALGARIKQARSKRNAAA